MEIKEKMKTQLDWLRINNDVNGNPRFVVHFLEVSPESWNDKPSSEHYHDTVKLMNKIGGKKYHNKSYGGGIVFQSYSLPDTEKHIFNLINTIETT